MTKAVTITDEMRAQVRKMASLGLRDSDIADLLDLGEATVQRRFRRELKRGRVQANLNVAQTAYNLAIGGQCPAATFFWMKCRAGWREVQRIETAVVDPKGLAIDE